MKHLIPLLIVSLLNVCCMPIGKKALKAHFDNTDIIFVDPCYFVKDEGTWEEYCEDFAKNKCLEKLGCVQGICVSVGDVSPEVIADETTGAVIGELCTDSNVLGCFRLEDVLKHNPDYAEEMEELPNSYLVIKGFTGDVVFETQKARYYDEVLPITTIIGKGSINFHSAFVDDDGVLHFKPDSFPD